MIRVMLMLWGLLCCCGAAVAERVPISGSVVDAVSGARLAGASLWNEVDGPLRSAGDGSFTLARGATQLVVRKAGYQPRTVAVVYPLQIRLQPVTPKALYLSFWAAESHKKRQQLLDLLDETGMNALVIDIKSSRGDIAYSSSLPMPQQAGAQRARTLRDLSALLAELKQRGIYSIARLVVFKDNLLARSRPDLAIRTLSGQLWSDREQMAWVDPFQQEVWDYNIDLAEEVARMGVDEIQFDYIRFPAKAELKFSRANTGANRVAAINGFLERARQRLAPYPVMTAANIFGYICWKPQDDKIGQRLAELSAHVDYISPMLYPSGFSHGIPGYPDPVANSYEVIRRSLDQAVASSGVEALRFRPWLQAFKDYAFDRRSFMASEVMAQVNASDRSGSHGWMLWNAASRFSLPGLQEDIPLGRLSLTAGDSGQGEESVASRSGGEQGPPPTL